VPQSAEGATYAAKLSRDDGRIDWTLDAIHIERQVRAYDPWPGTFTRLDGSVLKILSAEVAPGDGIAGTVLDGGLLVACGGGALRPTRVQLAGRAAMDAAAFLRGHPVTQGTLLGS
jgi:methionyl-tRNA formyltransferase